ncbi:universal stress protein [Aestuariicella hydrocarbonica]|uniref:Universal stress protein n=1 Tax=Pseudomaricurvus hydrocarbonicus TaxID=1470433 RepID=A0A9E5MQ89_9GAMM|nr:universal stress protein [Aestuariicella hydrocarbonica]NHO68435.1 universal stress protein [Aestuariicella hydrocarbonica]
MLPTLLFVVIDPHKEEQIALQRAEQLAVDTGARLHLFCCDYLEDISQFTSRKDAKHSTLTQHTAQLEALAQPLRDEGITVTTEAYWNDNWQNSVIYASSRAGADLILKSSFSHGALERRFLKTSDITLLRKASCSTLLVKSASPWMEQRILAAVTLDNDDPEHELLNNRIIKEAQRLSKATQSDLHCVTAHEHLPNIGDVLRLLEDEEDSTDEELISERFGVQPERVHIASGAPKDVIIAITKQLRADLLVIGTTARRGVKAALLGNTAEKVIDSVEMDVLVVN